MKTKLKTARLILAPFGIAFFTFGLGAIYYERFQDRYGEEAAREIEFPLGDVNSIAVDSKGRIFCALPVYSRIQAYDSTGNFLWGWFPEVGDRDFIMTLRGDEILVLADGNKDLLTYTAEGKLMDRSRVGPRLLTLFAESYSDGVFRTEQANYRIRRRGLGRSIERVQEAHVEIVIQPTIAQWLVQLPFPGWLFVGLGPAIFFFVVDPWTDLKAFRNMRKALREWERPANPFKP